MALLDLSLLTEGSLCAVKRFVFTEGGVSSSPDCRRVPSSHHRSGDRGLMTWPLPLSPSAGVGRTGTFIVIDAMVDMVHAEQKVDVFDFVSRIRNQRPQMVQTDVSHALLWPSHLCWCELGSANPDAPGHESGACRVVPGRDHVTPALFKAADGHYRQRLI